MSQNQIIVLNSDPEIIIIQDTGVQGAVGEGVPPGGSAGQILAKASGTNYDTEWIDSGLGMTGTPPIVVTANNISILQSGPSSNGYLSSVDWAVFNAKQVALGFTPENLANKGVANGYAPLDSTNHIPVGYIPSGIIGGLNFLGLWNASTNTPIIVSGVGTNGDYYKVSIAGNTVIDGIGSWSVGDWIIFNGSYWDKIANYESVTSVNGLTGAVVLNTDNISQGSTNLYFTSALARGVLSALTPLSYNSSTGQFSIQQANATQSGYLLNSDWSVFNGKQNALTFGNLTESTSSVLTIGNGLGAVIGTGTTIQVKQSSSTQDGFLSAIDWATFNAKQDAIGYTPANTYLSNLSSPTEINAHLVPNATSTFSLGNNNLSWDKVWADNIYSTSVLRFNLTDGTIFDPYNQKSIDIDNRYLLDSFSTVIFDWQNITLNDSSATLSADFANRTLADTSGITTASWGDGNFNVTNEIVVGGAIRGLNVQLTGTAGTGLVEIPRQSITPSGPASGVRIFADDNSEFAWTKSDGYQRIFASSATGNRRYTLQDSSGTLAFLSDIPPAASYTFSTGLTNTSSTITVNLSTGKAGGQGVIGGTASGEALTLSSTNNATKGKIYLGTSAYDEANNRLGIGTSSPATAFHLVGTARFASLTSGSIPFIDASTNLAQDNINLYWSTASTRMAVGSTNTATTYPINAMTSNTTSSPTSSQVTSASSEYSVSYQAWKAFSAGVSGGEWLSSLPFTNPQWVQIDLTTSVTINSYNLIASSSANSSMAQAWQLLGSNTGAFAGEQTVIDTRSAQTAWGSAESRSYSLASPVSFRYYRVNVTAVNGSSFLAIGRVQFLNAAYTNQTPLAKIHVTTSPTVDETALILQGAPTQTTPMLIVKNSAASNILSIVQDGSILYGTQYSFGSAGGYTTLLSGSNGIAFRDRSTSSAGISTIFWTLLNTSGITSYTPASFTTASTLTAQSYTQTWNNASGAFTGSLINITNTASGANSRIFDYQVSSTSRLSMTPTGFVGFSSSTPSARLHMGTTALSASAWGSSGIAVRQDAVTYTDTSTAASTTVATNMVNAIATPTLAATNTAVTFTDASTLYLAGPPTAGTNVTLSNAYTGYSNSGAWFFNGSTAAPALAGSQSAGDRMVFQNITGANTGKFAFGQSAVNQFYIQAYGTTASPRFNIFTTNSTTAPMVSIQSGSMVVGTGASGALSGSNATFEVLANGGSSGLRVGYNNNTTSGFYISDTNASGTYVGNARTSAQTPQAVGTANGLIQFNAAVMTFYSDTGLTSGNTYTPTRRMSLDRGWWTLGAFASNNLTNYLGTFYTGLTVNATGSGATGYFLTTRNTNSMISSTGAYYNSTNFTATETSAAGYWQDSGAHRFFTNIGLTAGNTFGATEQMRIDTNGFVGIGVNTPTARLDVGGAISASAWGLTGIQSYHEPATFTDTSTAASTTVTNNMVNSFGVPTLASTNASVTYTNSASLYLAGAPIAGTNVTLTNRFTLYASGSTSGNSSATAGFEQTNASSNAVIGRVTGSSCTSFVADGSSAATGIAFKTNASFGTGFLITANSNTISGVNGSAYSSSSGLMTLTVNNNNTQNPNALAIRIGNNGGTNAADYRYTSVAHGYLTTASVNGVNLLQSFNYMATGGTFYEAAYFGSLLIDNTGGSQVGALAWGTVNAGTVAERMRLQGTNLGIGVTNPTALLSLAGSTTTRASMNIATGTAPTSPNSGDVWHDATQKTTYINNAGVNQSHSGTLFTQTADATCANTTTETTLTSTGVGTLTLPANFFVAGKTIKLQAYGFHSSTSGTTITIRVKLGSTTILTASGTSGPDTNAGIIMDTVITCRTTGATGTVAGQGVYTEIGTSPNFRQMTNTAPVTVDTTTSQAITVTAQWGAASATRTITVTNLSVQVLN